MERVLLVHESRPRKKGLIGPASWMVKNRKGGLVGQIHRRLGFIGNEKKWVYEAWRHDTWESKVFPSMREAKKWLFESTKREGKRNGKEKE